MKPLFRFALLTSSLLVGGSAWGSADTSCYPEWNLKQTNLTGCS